MTILDLLAGRRAAAVSGGCLVIGLAAGGFLAQHAAARPQPPRRPAGTSPSAPPHILPFADRLDHPAQGPLPRQAKVSVPANVDGCDHAYGSAGQCVPWTFPAGVTDKCAWLKAHGLRNLPVHGTDRHHLDPGRKGVTCS